MSVPFWKLNNGAYWKLKKTNAINEKNVDIPAGNYQLVINASKTAVNNPIRTASVTVTITAGVSTQQQKFKLNAEKKQERWKFTVDTDSKLDLAVKTPALIKPLLIHATINKILAPPSSSNSIYKDQISKQIEEMQSEEMIKMIAELEKEAFDFASLSKKQIATFDQILENWQPVDGLTALTFDVTQCKIELERDSQWKQKAMKLGLIRPFLLFASMHPHFRMLCAGALEIKLQEFSCFGDAHREAFRLCTENRLGLQARANHAYADSINPLGNDANWYQILQRVCRKVFNTKEMGKESEVRTSIKSSRKTFDESIANCKTPRDADVLQLEQLFCEGYQQVTKKQNNSKQDSKDEANEQQENSNTDGKEEADEQQLLSEEQLKQIEIENEADQMALQHPLVPELKNKLHDASFDNDALVDFICATVIQGKSRLMLASLSGWYSKKKEAVITKSQGARIALPACMALVTIAILPMAPIVPFIMITANSAGYIFRETPGRLLVPLVMLLCQRILLALHGIMIDDYYPKSS